MYDTRPMRLIESLRDLGPVPQYLLNRQAAFGKTRGQRLTFQELHDDVVNSVLLAQVIKLADIGVAELRNSPRFTLETFAGVRLFRKMRGQNLDGDGAVDALIKRTIHLAHPASPQRCDDLIWTELGAGRERHARSRLYLVGCQVLRY